MCMVVFFSFVGCNNIEKKNEAAKEVLQKVLEKEECYEFDGEVMGMSECYVLDEEFEDDFDDSDIELPFN